MGAVIHAALLFMIEAVIIIKVSLEREIISSGFWRWIYLSLHVYICQLVISTFVSVPAYKAIGARGTTRDCFVKIENLVA